jgi:hypothetical protein
MYSAPSSAYYLVRQGERQVREDTVAAAVRRARHWRDRAGHPVAIIRVTGVIRTIMGTLA